MSIKIVSKGGTNSGVQEKEGESGTVESVTVGY